MIDLNTLTIQKAGRAFRDNEYSAEDLAKKYLENIEKKNKELNVYLEVFDDVLEQARRADALIKSGKAGELAGIPFAVKDNILIKGRRVSASSRILEGYVAPYDATVIEKLKKEGAVFLGRTNCDEFAMGSSTENSAFGVTRNPFDASRVAGGSSGGSAAAVSANMALVALGSDTGGSIREPASFCGAVGLKPTYGAVSRHGLIAMGSSLDCIGPIAKTAEDALSVFDCIKGKDSFDSTARDNFSSGVDFGKKNFVIADMTDFIKEIGKGGIDEEVLENYIETLTKFERAGHKVKKISCDLSSLALALPVYYILMPAEVSANLARFDGVKFGLHKSGENLLADYLETRRAGFGPEVRRRILLGTYVLSSGYYDAYYGKAVVAREKIKETFASAFKEVDMIATPTAPSPAWKVGEKADPLSVYLADIFTVTANIAGVPAISVPSGYTKSGLPLGVQFISANGGEKMLCGAGAVLKY